MDNVFLAVSNHNSRRFLHRGTSWGDSTINEDTDTANLISKNQNTPPSVPPTVPLSRVQTAFTPYDTPTQDRDFASRKTHLDTPLKQTRTPDSGTTLLEDAEGSDNGNFSYQNTPVDANVGGLGISVAMSSLERRRS
jgi:hypothetical protein